VTLLYLVDTDWVIHLAITPEEQIEVPDDPILIYLGESAGTV